MRRLSVFLVCLLGGCAAVSTGPFVSSVDERTGQSVVYAEQPLRFSTTRPNLSQVGKDYLVVSPLRASVEGTNRDYLFFALGSSIDRVLTDAAEPSVKRIILRADDQLMSFETSAWSDVSSDPPFAMRLLVHDMLVANVTQSEMAFIAQADSLSAWLLGENDRSPEYVLQSGDSSEWSGF